MSVQRVENTVVIADNDVADRQALAILLEALGYEVVPFEDGGSVLGYLREHTPDALILLATLPVINGISVCDRIKRVQRLSEVPVIIIAPVRDNKMMSAVRYVKADGFLQKPVDETVLKQTLDTLYSGNLTDLNIDQNAHTTLVSSLL
jgi:CheY-like chemotaxis protein